MTTRNIRKKNILSRLYQLRYRKLLLTILVCSLAFLICDNVIMPLYTRHDQEVKVPNVLNLSNNAAEKILARDGFRMIRGELTHDAYYPPGFVLFQNPEAGAKTKRGRRVYVTISSGERVVAMPKLVDQNLSNAKHTLRAWDLLLGDVELEFYSSLDDTIVTYQSVPEDAEVTVGTEIHITCKVRPLDKSTVPSLIGISIMEAKEKLNDAKLVLGKVIYQATDRLLPLTVIEQQPEASFETIIGDTVTLVVSKLPDDETVQSADTTKYR